MLAAAENTGQIDGDKTLPLLVGHLGDRHAAYGDCCVVDHDVEPAARLYRPGDQPGDVGILGYITMHVVGLVPSFAKRLDEGFSTRVLDVGHEDVRALLGHPL